MPESNMTSPIGIVKSQCKSCSNHYGGTIACAAYPDGIPRAILSNQHDHREPYPGDGGVRYEFSNRPTMEE
jgi:hypothetical protein